MALQSPFAAEHDVFTDMQGKPNNLVNKHSKTYPPRTTSLEKRAKLTITYNTASVVKLYRSCPRPMDAKTLILVLTLESDIGRACHTS